MAAAESLLCCRLRSSPLKAGAVEGRTLSGSPLSRNLHEEVHAMRELGGVPGEAAVTPWRRKMRTVDLGRGNSIARAVS